MQEKNGKSTQLWLRTHRTHSERLRVHMGLYGEGMLGSWAYHGKACSAPSRCLAGRAKTGRIHCGLWQVPHRSAHLQWGKCNLTYQVINNQRIFIAAVAHLLQVYTWGCSNYGQLGLGEVKESPHPRIVPGLVGEHVIALACGQYHTLALTNQGEVFAWGWGVHGQLGLGHVEDERTPRRVDSLSEHVRMTSDWIILTIHSCLV